MRVVTILILLLSTLYVVSGATIYGTIYDFSLQKASNVRVTINTDPVQQIIASTGRYSLSAPQGSYVITAEKIDSGEVAAKTELNITVSEDGSYVHDMVLSPSKKQVSGDRANEEPSQALPQDNQPTQPRQSNTNLIDTVIKYGIISAILLIIIILVIFAFKTPSSDDHMHDNGDSLSSQEETTEPENVTAVSQKDISKALQKPELEQPSLKKKASQDAPEDKKPGIQTTSDLPEPSPQGLPPDLARIVDFIKSNGNESSQKDIRKAFPQSEAKVSLMLAELEQRNIITKIKKGRSNMIILSDSQDPSQPF